MEVFLYCIISGSKFKGVGMQFIVKILFNLLKILQICNLHHSIQDNLSNILYPS